MLVMVHQNTFTKMIMYCILAYIDMRLISTLITTQAPTKELAVIKVKDIIFIFHFKRRVE